QPVPCEVGLQVPRCDSAKVPAEEVFWKRSPRNWRNSSAALSAEGDRTSGRQRLAGSHPLAAERPAQVQHRDDGGVPEGQECGANSSGTDEDEGNPVWASVLVTRVLRE